jgi:hypothetical protein
MDQRKFDRLTRLFGAPRSRRTAWRALLGAALLGATTRTAMAGPCDTGNNPQCTCGTNRTCPPGMCFVDSGGQCPVCCTEENDLTLCVGKTIDAATRKAIREPTCCKGTKDACEACVPPAPPPGATCFDYVGGSYRRR